jgi:hypothetical protein
MSFQTIYSTNYDTIYKHHYLTYLLSDFAWFFATHRQQPFVFPSNNIWITKGENLSIISGLEPFAIKCQRVFHKLFQWVEFADSGKA